MGDLLPTTKRAQHLPELMHFRLSLLCTTPAYSPESNGVAEAFMKTFRRDYVYLAGPRDAATVLAFLEA